MQIKKQALIDRLQTIINDISNREYDSIECEKPTSSRSMPYVNIRIIGGSYDFRLEMLITGGEIDNNTAAKDVFEVANEKAIHNRFRELAQEICNKDHICVRSMFIDWRSGSTEMIVNEVRMETITK